MGLNKRLIGAGAVGSGALTPSENFKAVIYTGNGGTQAITGVGFQPDFVWIKNRTSNGQGPLIQDSTRGTGSTKVLFSSENTAEGTYGQYGHVSAFGSDGFTVVDGDGKHTNSSGENYVAWCWKANGGTTSSNSDGDITSTVQANQAAGFSITTYTNNGSNSARVGHGLGTTPKIVLIKKYSVTGSWHFMTTAIDGSFDDLILNDLTAKSDSSLTAPTDTTFAAESGGSGENMICYAFSDVASFSKFGSYTGNSSNDGPIVETGFEPAFLMIKCASDAGSWFMYDNKRNTSNPRINYVLANATNAEASDMGGVDFFSNGFQIKEDHDDVNDTGDTYIYMAFAADPDTEAPTLASSFNIETYTGDGANPRSLSGFGFSPNFLWIKKRSGADDNVLFDSVRGPQKELITNSTAAEATKSGDAIISFDTDGFTTGNNGAINASSSNYVAWSWKADDNEPTINDNGSIDSIVSANANAGFSIVKYTGTGADATIGHGLSAAPDMLIVKGLETTNDWSVLHSAVTNGNFFQLNSTSAPSGSGSIFGSTFAFPNATTFQVGNTGESGTADKQYIAYCFHDVAGYQKFGSYTGDGNNDRAVTTGFKPDFVLIKSTVGSDNWRLYDTRRGVEEGGYLEPNRTDGDDTSNAPNLTMTSTGFTITSGGVTAGNNVNGNLYIYWAIAKNVPSNTTLANSFKTVTYTGNSTNDFGTTLTQSVTGVGFKPDLVWIKNRNHTYSHGLFDRVRGETHQVQSNSNAAQSSSDGYLKSFDSDGFGLGGDFAFNRNTYTYVAWCFKAGNQWQSNVTGTIPSTVNANTANGFSIVKWTGTGSNGTVGHGLSSTPELIISKNIDTAATDGFPVFTTSIGNDHTLFLNTTAGKTSTGGTWGSTSPTSSVFTVQDNAANNQSSNEIIAYCWHSVSGYSKIGTFSGNSSTQSITGVGFQPDWIMIKRTDGTENWYIQDSVRGSTKQLYANLNNAEYDETGAITSFDSDGWTMGSYNGINNSGEDYIYMAFKMN